MSLANKSPTLTRQLIAATPMSLRTTPLQPSVSVDACPCGPCHPPRYDTALCDLSALSPHVSKTKAGPMKSNDTQHMSFWRESLVLIERHLAFERRKVNCGDYAYQYGQNFDALYLVSSGIFKIVNLAADGRQQPAGVYFKGEWLGFDGIPTGSHVCSAIALDIGEVWLVRYEALLTVCAKEPLLMRLLMAAISAQLVRHRNAAMAMGTLSADARVADFLLQWTHALAERGLRTDQINVNMSRADIGNYIGLRVESVSRSLSKLAQCGIIQFNEKRRRDICIPHIEALRDFIQISADSACV
jgi:CRP/FNR family transcriptional regulator